MNALALEALNRTNNPTSSTEMKNIFSRATFCRTSLKRLAKNKSASTIFSCHVFRVTRFQFGH